MLKIIRSEPAVIAGAVGTVLALALAFGVHLSAGQVGAIDAVVSAVLGLVVRSQVTPTVSVPPPLAMPAVPMPPAAAPDVPYTPPAP